MYDKTRHCGTDPCAVKVRVLGSCELETGMPAKGIAPGLRSTDELAVIAAHKRTRVNRE